MVADQPQTATELARILALDRNTVEEALRALHDDYEGDESRDIRPRGFELRRTARGWQFASRAAFEPVVSSFVTDGQTARLSQAALEALAIVAYRQPVTRAQVAAIRGVNSDGVIRSLTVRGLIKEDGVDPESRAALLVTSEFFLDQMGLKSLDELPSLAPFLVRRRNDTVEIGRYGRDFVAIGARYLTNIRALTIRYVIYGHCDYK
ncbi:MAG: SMC-Scp complex subunit ScpB [Bifidobacterium sp.]